MASISSPGIGTGLDINGLLEQLVAAERKPTENRLNRKEANIQAEITAYGALKGSLSGFQSSLSSLKNISSFSSNKASVTNEDLLSATASNIAQPGNYSVEVSKLADSHSIASVAFDDIEDTIGNGTLTFNFGTTSYDSGTDTYTSFVKNSERSSESITITNANNTVQGLRDAINNADIGVSATIVDDGSGYRLLLTSDQAGFDNSLEVSVDEGGTGAENLDTTGLSQLAFNIGATNLEQTQAAQDADLTVNGLQIFRESNSVSGAIHGVTLDLLSVDLGNPTQVSITKNTGTVKTNIEKFVTAYNELTTVLNSLTQFGGAGGQNGILLGDNTTRNIITDARNILASSVTTSGSFDSLGSIGITTENDGTLKLDAGTLSSALSSDFTSVTELFFANGVATDSGVNFSRSGSNSVEGEYAINVTSLATRGTLTGSTVSGPITIDGSNDSFSFSIDGVGTNVVSITQAVYSDMDALATEIQNRINAVSALDSAGASVSVSYETDHFEVTSDSYGSDSTVSIGTENSSLGFGISSVSTDGADIAGTIGGFQATGSGQFLTGTGDANGLVVEIASGATGRRGSVTFNHGMAGKLDALLSNVLSTTGTLTAKTSNLDEQVSQINRERATLDVRMAMVEERFQKQFIALDVLVSQLTATGDFLTQQLENLPKIQSNK